MIKATVVGLVLTCVAAPAWAADNPSVETTPSGPTELEELMKMAVPTVQAASKYLQPVSEAPGSVTIIQADEVKKYGYRTLADILESVPGLYVTYDRNYSFLGVRGFNLGDYNNRVLLMIDGHRMNNSISDSAAIGTDFLLDVDLIDHVEVIRGPGSSLYGNNAFFGVVNVVTRKGRDMAGNGAEVSGEAGSFDTYKGRVTYGRQFNNGLEVLFSGTIYDSEGQDSLYYPEFDQRINPQNPLASNNGIAQNADADDYKSCFGSLAFHDFSLEGGYITREKGNPTAQYTTLFNDPRFRTTDDRGYANLKYAHEFAEVADVTAQVYYDRQNSTAILPVTGLLFKEAQAAEWWGADMQLTKHLWERITLILGGEYRHDFRQELQFLNAETGAPTRDPINQDRQNYGIYFQTDFAICTNLHFNGGVRYDQYGDFDPAFNPRLALIYNPLGQATLKAIYGTAFRAPNVFELNAVSSPGLVPETIKTYELVYEQGIGRHVRSSISGFYNQIDDLIQYNFAAAPQGFQNLSGAKAEGVECSLEAYWPTGLRARASYSFQQTENESTGEVLTDSPEHLAKLNLSVPVVRDRLFAGVEFQYVSRRTSSISTPTGPEPGADVAGHEVVNLTLFSQKLLKGLELSASVYNLFDKRFSDPSTPFHEQAMIEQDGRTFRLKLTYRF
jgi:outer membrane receptor for ferrienterochelin and colicins